MPTIKHSNYKRVERVKQSYDPVLLQAYAVVVATILYINCRNLTTSATNGTKHYNWKSSLQREENRRVRELSKGSLPSVPIISYKEAVPISWLEEKPNRIRFNPKKRWYASNVGLGAGKGFLVVEDSERNEIVKFKIKDTVQDADAKALAILSKLRPNEKSSIEWLPSTSGQGGGKLTIRLQKKLETVPTSFNIKVSLIYLTKDEGVKKALKKHGKKHGFTINSEAFKKLVADESELAKKINLELGFPESHPIIVLNSTIWRRKQPETVIQLRVAALVEISIFEVNPFSGMITAKSPLKIIHLKQAVCRKMLRNNADLVVPLIVGDEKNLSSRKMHVSSVMTSQGKKCTRKINSSMEISFPSCSLTEKQKWNVEPEVAAKYVFPDGVTLDEYIPIWMIGRRSKLSGNIFNTLGSRRSQFSASKIYVDQKLFSVKDFPGRIVTSKAIRRMVQKEGTDVPIMSTITIHFVNGEESKEPVFPVMLKLVKESGIVEEKVVKIQEISKGITPAKFAIQFIFPNFEAIGNDATPQSLSKLSLNGRPWKSGSLAKRLGRKRVGVVRFKIKEEANRRIAPPFPIYYGVVIVTGNHKSVDKSIRTFGKMLEAQHLHNFKVSIIGKDEGIANCKLTKASHLTKWTSSKAHLYCEKSPAMLGKGWFIIAVKVAAAMARRGDEAIAKVESIVETHMTLPAGFQQPDGDIALSSFLKFAGVLNAPATESRLDGYTSIYGTFVSCEAISKAVDTSFSESVGSKEIWKSCALKQILTYQSATLNLWKNAPPEYAAVIIRKKDKVSSDIVKELKFPLRRIKASMFGKVRSTGNFLVRLEAGENQQLCGVAGSVIRRASPFAILKACGINRNVTKSLAEWTFSVRPQLEAQDVQELFPKMGPLYYTLTLLDKFGFVIHGQNVGKAKKAIGKYTHDLFGSFPHLLKDLYRMLLKNTYSFSLWYMTRSGKQKRCKGVNNQFKVSNLDWKSLVKYCSLDLESSTAEEFNFYLKRENVPLQAQKGGFATQHIREISSKEYAFTCEVPELDSSSSMGKLMEDPLVHLLEQRVSPKKAVLVVRGATMDGTPVRFQENVANVIKTNKTIDDLLKDSTGKSLRQMSDLSVNIEPDTNVPREKLDERESAFIEVSLPWNEFFAKMHTVLQAKIQDLLETNPGVDWNELKIRTITLQLILGDKVNTCNYDTLEELKQEKSGKSFFAKCFVKAMKYNPQIKFCLMIHEGRSDIQKNEGNKEASTVLLDATKKLKARVGVELMLKKQFEVIVRKPNRSATKIKLVGKDLAEGKIEDLGLTETKDSTIEEIRITDLGESQDGGLETKNRQILIYAEDFYGVSSGMMTVGVADNAYEVLSRMFQQLSIEVFPRSFLIYTNRILFCQLGEFGRESSIDQLLSKCSNLGKSAEEAQLVGFKALHIYEGSPMSKVYFQGFTPPHPVPEITESRLPENYITDILKNYGKYGLHLNKPHFIGAQIKGYNYDIFKLPAIHRFQVPALRTEGFFKLIVSEERKENSFSKVSLEEARFPGTFKDYLRQHKLPNTYDKIKIFNELTGSIVNLADLDPHYLEDGVMELKRNGLRLLHVNTPEDAKMIELNIISLDGSVIMKAGQVTDMQMSISSLFPKVKLNNKDNAAHSNIVVWIDGERCSLLLRKDSALQELSISNIFSSCHVNDITSQHYIDIMLLDNHGNSRAHRLQYSYNWEGSSSQVSETELSSTVEPLIRAFPREVQGTRFMVVATTSNGGITLGQMEGDASRLVNGLRSKMAFSELLVEMGVESTALHRIRIAHFFLERWDDSLENIWVPTLIISFQGQKWKYSKVGLGKILSDFLPKPAAQAARSSETSERIALSIVNSKGSEMKKTSEAVTLPSVLDSPIWALIAISGVDMKPLNIRSISRVTLVLK